MIYFNAYLMNRKSEEATTFWWIHILILCTRIALITVSLIREKHVFYQRRWYGGGSRYRISWKTSVLNNWECERNRNYYCLLLHSAFEGEMGSMKSYFIPQGTLWRTHIIKGSATLENIMHGNEKAGEKKEKCMSAVGWDGCRWTWCLV